MNEMIKKADLLDRMLAAENLSRYSYTLSESEKQELNIENGDFKLMRTVFNRSGFLKVFLGDRMGSARGNDTTEEGLARLIRDSRAAAESSPEDPCHGIAPDQGKDVFRQGAEEPDLDRFAERIRELLDTIAADYPLVRVMAAIGSFDRRHWISRNTNGTEFEGFGGQYGFFLEICATDGEKTTGLDYTGFSAESLDRPLIEAGDVRRHLEDIQNSISPRALEGKFEGTVIMTPGCAAEFLQMLIGNYMESRVIMDGTSLWLNRIGEQVAGEGLTVSLDPFDPRIVGGERATPDGFRAEKVTLIEKGILRSHFLSLYAANRTGRPVTKNSGSGLVIEAGGTPLAEMVASLDRGLILGGFSGGAPGTNGEFSGVAKNSFLVEHGKVTAAVTETMVNGNLGEIFRKIRAISRELTCDGEAVVPYIAVDGMVISGK